jgi:hypothetical protein
MEGLSVALLVVAGALLLWWLPRTQRGENDAVGTVAQEGERRPSFHAVEIRAPDGGCNTVRALAGKRFLSAEAPPIPLRSCGRDTCACYYVHHDDRRAGQRRNMQAQGGHSNAGGVIERRRSVGRRAADRILFDGGH